MDGITDDRDVTKNFGDLCTLDSEIQGTALYGTVEILLNEERGGGSQCCVNNNAKY
jgi:hypothetical protein